ncbi:hypothetical protein O5707_07400 [Escherichia coli]|nr:hypothetical protein [Escherichia coli]
MARSVCTPVSVTTLVAAKVPPDAVAVDLHDGVAAALGDFDKITDVSSLRIQRCHAVDVAGFAVCRCSRCPVTTRGYQCDRCRRCASHVPTVKPFTTSEPLPPVASLALSNLSEQGIVTAVSDVKGVVAAAPLPVGLSPLLPVRCR